MELEVGDGEEAAGRPAGGSKTLAVVEMGYDGPGMSSYGSGVRRGGVGVGRGPGGGGGGEPGKNCQPDGVGRKKRAPNTYEILAPERPCLYTHDDL